MIVESVFVAFKRVSVSVIKHRRAEKFEFVTECPETLDISQQVSFFFVFKRVAQEKHQQAKKVNG